MAGLFEWFRRLFVGGQSTSRVHLVSVTGGKRMSMGVVFINGRRIEVRGSEVYIDNRRYVPADGAAPSAPELPEHYTLNLDQDGRVGDVDGDLHIYVSGSPNIVVGNVSGSVQVDGALRCGTVDGSVTAGSDVHAAAIGGSVTAGRDVNAKKIGGSVIAARSVGTVNL